MCVTLRTKWVTTRKPHNCYGCAQQFPPKTLMECSTIVNDDGEICDSYLCSDCSKLLEAAYKHNAISSFCDEFPEYGELGYWLADPGYYGIPEEVLIEAQSK